MDEITALASYGSHLASGSDDGSIVLWDLNLTEELLPLPPPPFSGQSSI